MEFQKTGLSVQASGSSNNDTVATAVHQIMTELSKAVSEEDSNGHYKIIIVFIFILRNLKTK
jgi:hypothetical protein